MKRIEAPLLTLPDFIGNHGRYLADHPAIVHHGQALSWQAVDRRTNQIAQGLIAKGIGPGDRVAVVMKNCPETILCFLAIMKAGACSVPLNLSITDAAMVGMIEDSGARLVFATADQAARLEAMRDQLPAALGDNLIVVGVEQPEQPWIAFAAWADGFEPTDPGARVDPALPCNIIYSSGTTGLPKGITHSYAGRLAWGRDCALAFRFNRDARVLCTIGLYSNIMWVPMLTAIVTGCTLVLHDGFNPADCLSAFRDEQITHCTMVPIQYQALVDAGATAQDLKGLTCAITVGSKMPAPLKTKLANLMPDTLFEVWGLTEGILTAQQPADAARHPASVGRPLPGCELMILDETDQPCPPDTAGEVISRAEFVMMGYWNRDDATEEVHFQDNDGRSWLRTGDIGRLDTAGNLTIIDRKKDLIISGGQNIYPLDIEAVLLDHPAVADCAVIGIPHEKWQETPFAVVVPKGPIDEADLVGWVNARVGRQQRISGVRTVSSLPRNPNGKVLKRQLRDAWNTGDL